MNEAAHWYKTVDGRWLASTLPWEADGLIEVTERDYTTEIRKRERAEYDAEMQRGRVRDEAVSRRATARAALAAKLNLTDDALSLLG